MALIAELRRRNIFKVALLYVVAAWVLLQLAGILFGPIGVPDWVYRFTFGMLVICFPLALVFSWIFEITPWGIKRESDVGEGESITHHTGRRIYRIIVILLVLAIALAIVENLIPEQGSAGDVPVEDSVEPAAIESSLTESGHPATIPATAQARVAGDIEPGDIKPGIIKHYPGSS